MQQKEVTMYPYVVLDLKGNFSYAGMYSWKTDDAIGENTITIGLAPMSVTVSVPDDQKLLEGALTLLKEQQNKVKIELQGKLIWLKQVENQLLRLESPDILDPVDLRELSPDRDGDIPF